MVESQPSHSRGSNSRGAFSGTGYRLGETGNDSQGMFANVINDIVYCVVDPLITVLCFLLVVIALKKSEDQSQVAITLKFWKNGFSVNDGPLRPFDDPENADFLHHIKHG